MDQPVSPIPLEYSAEAQRATGRPILGLPPVIFWRVVAVCGLLVLLFWPNLRRLWLKTNFFTGESNWQHSLLVPLIGLYYLYLNREALLTARQAPAWRPRMAALGVWAMAYAMLLGLLFFLYLLYPTAFDPRFHTRLILLVAPHVLGAGLLALAWWSTGPVPGWARRRAGWKTRLRDAFAGLAREAYYWFGLYALLWGLLFYGWGIWPGQNDFAKDLAMVVVIFGAVLLMTGWQVMRIAWFPIFFLICAIPWPQLMYSQIAMPLQQLAATVAAWTLRLTGVEAVRIGTRMIIGEGENVRHLNVAEACAGLKSLMTFVSLGAAVAFLSARPLWQKLVISVSAIPIAIFCNVLRVTGQGLLDHYVSHEWSENFAHQFVGLLMLLPAFLLILLVAWVLDNLFIEEVDTRRLRAGASAAPAGTLVVDIPRPRAPTATPASASGVPARPAAAPASDLAAAAARLAALRQPRTEARRWPGTTPAGSRP
jgi:exosortase